MRVGPYKRLGMDLPTTWGTYPSPYITQPASAVLKPWLPPTLRGRHPYRTQPRPLTVPIDTQPHDGAATDIAMRGRSSLVMPPRPAHGVGADDPQKETKLGMYAFVGALGLLYVGWLAISDTPTRKNPRSRGSRNKAGLWRQLAKVDRDELAAEYGSYGKVPMSELRFLVTGRR